MAYAPGDDVGTLKFIPGTMRRTVTFQLAGGTATTFTDAWGAGVANPYTPNGVKGLLLDWYVVWPGDGAADYSLWELRKNGSTETDTVSLITVGIGYTNLSSGVTMQHRSNVSVPCDSSGIIEYRFYQGNAAKGSLYLTTMGYYM